MASDVVMGSRSWAVNTSPPVEHDGDQKTTDDQQRGETAGLE